MVAGDDIKVGQVVRSKAGRDKGRFFIVVSVEGDRVYLADGDLRRVEAPKKKNIKHIQVTGHVVEKIAEKIEKGQNLSNKEFRRELQSLGYLGDGMLEKGKKEVDA